MIHPRIFRKNFLNLSERIFSSLKCNTTDHDKQPELDEKIFIPENCNNTLRGSEGSWTIVHLISKPFDPTHVAFSCLLKFEGKANQVVQLKFLGTNLREESKFCSRNYFTIRDFSRFDQMPHSSIYNTITPSSMRIHSTNFSDNYSKHGHLMIPGHFCSFATQKSELDSKYLFAHNMNYFSEHDTLELYLRKDFFAQKHILRPAYLKFKFAYRFIYADQVLTREGTINEPIFRGDKIPNTYCDKIFVGCGGASNSNRNCRIQSPGWPGTYLRNLYCKYHVISNPDPGKDVHISLTLNVKNVVDNAGDNSVLTKTSSKITNPKLKSLEDNNLKKYEIESSNRKRCWRFGDRIEIYEGLKESAQNLIIMFCGGVGKGDTENYLLNTPINQITSRTNTLLIVFRTAAQGKFGYPGFEIAIETVEHSASLTGSILPSPYFSSCHFTIDGSRHKSGFFSSLRHWIKARTMCTLKFKGIPGRQRVLLTFKRFLIKSFSPETYVKERKANRRMVKHTKEDNKKNDSNAKFNTKLLCDRYVTIQLMELPEGEELPNNDNHNHSYKLPVENFPSRATTTTFTTNEKKIITLCSGDVYHNRVTRVEEVSREFQIDEGQEGGIEGVETIFDVLSENSLAYVRYFENQTNFEAPNIRFEGIYQFIDVTHPPYGELKSNTMCDYVFYQPEDNETESLSIQNPANELFYGLGRFQAMKCTYEFRAKSKYEVSINLDYLKFNLVDEKPEHEIKPMIDCTTIYNITTQAYQCVNIVWPTRFY